MEKTQLQKSHDTVPLSY